MGQPSPRPRRMVSCGTVSSSTSIKTEQSIILVDDDDDDGEPYGVIEVPSDGDFSGGDSLDDYVPISSESSDEEEDSDRPRSRRSTGSRRSSVSASTARQRQRQQQPPLPPPPQPPATTPRNTTTMRKRSMSLFAEPAVVLDEALDDELLSSDEEEDDDDTAAATSSGDNSAGTWSTEEKHALLQAIESRLPNNDTFSYTRRLKALDWERIKVPGHSAQDCKEQLMLLLKKVRHIRNVRELLGDVRHELNNPKAPRNTSAYLLFCKDYRKTNPSQGRESMAKWAEAFRQLTAQQRQHYEDLATKVRGGNTVKRMKAKIESDLISAQNTPFTLYCRERVAEGAVSKLQLRSDYAKLPDEEKLVYVRQAVDLAKADGTDAIDLLTSKEMKLLKSHKSMTGYSLFMREFFQENANTSVTDMSKRYRELSDAEKNELKIRAMRLKEEIKEPQPKAAAVKSRKIDSYLAVDKPKAANKKTASNGVAPEELPSPIKKSTTPGKKNKSLVQTSLNFGAKSLDDDSSVLLPPPATPDSSRSKRKSNGDSVAGANAAGELLTPIKTTGRRSIKMESSSETDSSAKKRRVKAEKPREVEPPKVPTTVFGYFAERVFEGKPKKAKKAFDKLDATEKKNLKREARKCMSDYMERLERYLKSLSKTEMVEYANRSRQLVNEQTDEDFLGSSSSD